jgi:hypothetical protein
MEHVETRVDQVRMVKLSESDIEPRIKKHVRELIGTVNSWQRRMGATTHRRRHGFEGTCGGKPH